VPPPVRLSVSNLSSPSIPSFTAELNGSSLIMASRYSIIGKKIDFKQTIIDFQEKTILTSLGCIHKFDQIDPVVSQSALL